MFCQCRRCVKLFAAQTKHLKSIFYFFHINTTDNSSSTTATPHSVTVSVKTPFIPWTLSAPVFHLCAWDVHVSEKKISLTLDVFFCVFVTFIKWQIQFRSLSKISQFLNLFGKTAKLFFKVLFIFSLKYWCQCGR